MITCCFAHFCPTFFCPQTVSDHLSLSPPAQAQHHRLPSRRDKSQEEKHLTDMVRQAGMDELIITIASNYYVAMTAADP